MLLHLKISHWVQGTLLTLLKIFFALIVELKDLHLQKISTNFSAQNAERGPNFTGHTINKMKTFGLISNLGMHGVFHIDDNVLTNIFPFCLENMQFENVIS